MGVHTHTGGKDTRLLVHICAKGRKAGRFLQFSLRQSCNINTVIYSLKIHIKIAHNSRESTGSMGDNSQSPAAAISLPVSRAPGPLESGATRHSLWDAVFLEEAGTPRNRPAIFVAFPVSLAFQPFQCQLRVAFKGDGR